MAIPNGPCGLCRGKGKRLVTNIRTMKVDWKTCCDCEGTGWIGRKSAADRAREHGFQMPSEQQQEDTIRQEDGS